MRRVPTPTLRVERGLLRSGAAAVACVDEAGRGSVAGSVAVSMVVVTSASPPAPRGVRDSKLLSPAQRHALVPQIRQWAPHAVGMASAGEIDEMGIVAALRLAGHRALAALPVAVDHVLLDGDVDYLTPPAGECRALGGRISASCPSWPAGLPVTAMVKADLRCAGVAAASILAKESRDQVMVALHGQFPEYGWAVNKGYGSASHMQAIARLGPCEHHRRSWRLPSRLPSG